MGVVEWVALATLAVTLFGSIIKGYQDKASITQKVWALEAWRCKMEKLDLMTHQEHEYDKTSCRVEMYKDINRLETRFEKFLETMATNEDKRREIEGALRKDIGEVKEKMVRALTILENRYPNSTSTNIL